MRLYRCRTCTCGFAIFMRRGRENKGGKSITCPVCATQNVEEVDAIKEVSGHLAKKAFEFWKRMP